MKAVADYSRIGHSITISLSDFNEDDLDSMKSIRMSKYNPRDKVWEVPLRYAPHIKKAFPCMTWFDEERHLVALADYDSLQHDEPVKLDIPSRYKFKREPFDHQRTIIKEILNNEKYAILAEMGTGKTQSIVNAIDILDQIGKNVFPCLVVSPKSVIENWGEEISCNTFRKSSGSLRGTRKQRISRLKEDKHFYIINYEGCEVIKEELRQKGFKTIILDESTYIKNHRAQRTQAINYIAQQTPRRYLLTGTPITNAPMDAFSQFRFLSPHFLGFNSFYAFRGHFCIMGGFKNKQVMTYKNLDELQLSIAKHSIRILKKDCLDLPDKLYQTRRLDITEELKIQYKEMVKDLQLTLNQTVSEDGSPNTIKAPIVLTQLLRLAQISSGNYLPEGAKNPKVDEVMSIMDECGGKVVIWCQFRDSITLLQQALKAKGIHFVWLTGDTKDRQDIINKFNKDKTVRVFLGMVQAGGIGINLTAATTTIYFENTFSLQSRLQSEDRTHRIGTKSNVTYIDLVYAKTIDEKIIGALKNKKNMASYIVDFAKEVVA